MNKFFPPEILGEPRNVKVERISDSSLQVSWDVPLGSKWDDDIIYTVENNSPDSFGDIYNFHHSNCQNLRCSLELKDLEENAQYSTKV